MKENSQKTVGLVLGAVGLLAVFFYTFSKYNK